MRSPINRRAFLRAASASAVMAGAGATTLAAASEHPDAKLLALEAELDRLLPLYEKAADALTAAHEKFQRSGVRLDAPDAWARYCAENEAVEDEHTRAEQALNLAEEALVATPAATAVGLAVKARLLRYRLGIAPNSDPDRSQWDFEQEAFADFIEEAERLAAAGRA